MGAFAVTYVLLTLLVGGTALVNLWQRGTMWEGIASKVGLAAAWLNPRQRPRLQTGLIVVAASLLIALVFFQ